MRTCRDWAVLRTQHNSLGSCLCLFNLWIAPVLYMKTPMHVMPQLGMNQILLMLVYQWFSNMYTRVVLKQQLQCFAQKRSCNLFMGVKILFIITWKNRKARTMRIISLKSIALPSPGTHVEVLSC